MQDISFKNGRNETLRGYVHKPRKYSTAVIFLHGFPSDSTSSTITFLSKTLKFLGFLTMRFDFSGCGRSEGKFEEKTFSKEVEDIKHAVDFLEENYDYDKLVLVGHSGGAIDTALYAHKDKRVDKVILLACPSDLASTVEREFTEQQIKNFKEKGHIVYDRPGEWYHKKMLNRDMYDEFFELDIIENMKKYNNPLLIVHGQKDRLIPVEQARELYGKSNDPKQLKIIKNTGHRFKGIINRIILLKTINSFLKQRK